MTLTWTALGDFARPFCIYFLGICIGLGPFFHVDPTLYAALGLPFLALIGARSYENQVATKTGATTEQVRIQTAAAAQPGGVSSSTPAATAIAAPEPKKEP